MTTTTRTERMTVRTVAVTVERYHGPRPTDPAGTKAYDVRLDEGEYAYPDYLGLVFGKGTAWQAESFGMVIPAVFSTRREAIAALTVED